MSTLKPYPAWVCPWCIKKAGGVQRVGTMAIFHKDICDVCRKITFVTEPRDYGYPKFEGHEYGG